MVGRELNYSSNERPAVCYLQIGPQSFTAVIKVTLARRFPVNPTVNRVEHVHCTHPDGLINCKGGLVGSGSGLVGNVSNLTK